MNSESARRDRAVTSSAGAAVVARLVTSLGAFVTVAMAARSLSHAELGIVSVLTTLIVLLGFGDLGLGAMLMTRLPAAYARHEHEAMRELVRSVTSALLLVAGGVAAVGSLSLLVVPWRSALGAQSVSVADLTWTLVAFLLTGALGIVGAVGTRVLLALQHGALIRSLNAVAVAFSVLAVGACSAVHAPMWAFMLAISVPGPAVGLLELVWATRVKYPFLALDRHVVDVVGGVRCLRLGTGYAVLSLGWVVAYTLDSIVISAVKGAAAAAVFAVAARLFSLIGGTLQLAGQQMWPAISDALARGDVAWVRRRFRQSLLTVGAVSGVGCIVLVLAGRIIARVWVGAGLVPPLSLFIAFAVWTTYLAVMTQYTYLLVACDRIRALAYLGIGVAVLNLVASIVLTRWLGLVGPVLGNIVAAAVLQVVPTVVMSRRLATDLGILPDKPSYATL